MFIYPIHSRFPEYKMPLTPVLRTAYVKMQAMKGTKPLEYTTTTNTKGEARVQLLHKLQDHAKLVLTGNQQLTKAQVVFKPDSTQAHIYSVIVTRAKAIADGGQQIQFKLILLTK